MINKTISLFICLLVVSTLSIGVSAATPTSISINSYDKIPNIDGIVDAVYGNPVFDYNARGATVWYDNIDKTSKAAIASVNNMSAKGYMLWNSKYLYFASKCTDTKFYDAENRNGFYLATDNRLLLSIDGRQVDVCIFQTEREGTLACTSKDGTVVYLDGASTKAKIDGGKYSFETKIPWSSLGVKHPKTIKNIAFNFRQTSQTTTDPYAKAVISFLAEKQFPLFLKGDGIFDNAAVDNQETNIYNNTIQGQTYVTVPKKITSFDTLTAPKIDGIIDDIYGDPFCYLVARDLQDKNIYPDSKPELNLFMLPEIKNRMQALAYTIWDKDNIYVSAKVIGSLRGTLTAARRNMFWEADNCEFIIWVNGTRKKLTFCYDENKKMKVFDSGIEDTSEWKMALNEDTNGFVFEVAIPWSYYGVTPAPGASYKLSFDAMTHWGNQGVIIGYPFDNIEDKAIPFVLAKNPVSSLSSKTASTDSQVASRDQTISSSSQNPNQQKQNPNNTMILYLSIIIFIIVIVITLAILRYKNVIGGKKNEN
jgi:hypothetical protein